MATELGHNYNIHCMKLFQELKAAYPSIPDDVVKQCMKSNRNVKGKCIDDLSKESQKDFLGRYNRALLSHQMEQLFKLEKELRMEKNEMHLVKSDVQDLEMKVKQRAFSLHGQPTRLQRVEVHKLEQDIEGLRGLCDNMAKKVTSLTGGKVPLGEDSIKDYKPYLSQEPPVPDTSDGSVATVPCANPNLSTNNDPGKWNCSECTFTNHPSLDTCEICEMPRITMGTNKHPHISGPCFCHPQDTAGQCHSFPKIGLEGQSVNTQCDQNPKESSETTSSIEAHPPSRLHSC